MTTKIKDLTGMNVRALREECSDLCTEITASTATFAGDPSEALGALRERVVALNLAGSPAKRHPLASLHAVQRKLAAQIVPLTTEQANAIVFGEVR